MGGEEAMIVAGVGFRRGVLPGEIVELVARALAEASLPLDSLAFLATAELRSAEPGFNEAARRLGIEPSGVGADAMAAAGLRVRTVSERVKALHGVGSVAEAAALACAGDDAELLLPRIASARATCALARGSAR
jgi:cobalt-precorrin 5A hydrolase